MARGGAATNFIYKSLIIHCGGRSVLSSGTGGARRPTAPLHPAEASGHEPSFMGRSYRFTRIYDETLVTNIAFTLARSALACCGSAAGRPVNARRCDTVRCARQRRRRARRRRTGPIRADPPPLPPRPRRRLPRSPPGNRGAR